MQRIIIDKESTSKVLDEKITVYLDKKEMKNYISLLKRTWPKTRVQAKSAAA